MLFHFTANNLSKLTQLVSSQNFLKLVRKKSQKNTDDHFMYFVNIENRFFYGVIIEPIRQSLLRDLFEIIV